MPRAPTPPPCNVVTRLTPAEIRRIAAEAGVEPRTAAKYLRGQPVLSTCADRIGRAIVALGFGTTKVQR